MSHQLLLEMQQEFDNLRPLVKADLSNTDVIKKDILSESDVISNSKYFSKVYSLTNNIISFYISSDWLSLRFKLHDDRMNNDVT